MTINAIRMELVELEPNEPRTGMLYFTDDGNGNPIATHKIVIYAEWSNVAKTVYDNPETPWKVIPFNGHPLVIEDANGNPV